MSKPLGGFWPKVLITPACWEWQGAKVNGYGSYYLGAGRKKPAHRASYELHFGPIPNGLIVRHRCDNPPCVNPDHLELGTDADNARDKVERGRAPRGEGNAKSRLSAADVTEIRTSPETQVSLAARFGVTQPCISNIRTGRTWGHL